MIDPETLNCLSEWQGVDPPHEGPNPMIVEPPQDTAVTNDQMNHINTNLETEELMEEQKCALIKEYLNVNN